MSTARTCVYHDRAFSDVITLGFFQRIIPSSFIKQKKVFGVNQVFACFFYILKVYKELVRELHEKKLRYRKESRVRPLSQRSNQLFPSPIPAFVFTVYHY